MKRESNMKRGSGLRWLSDERWRSLLENDYLQEPVEELFIDEEKVGIIVSFEALRWDEREYCQSIGFFEALDFPEPVPTCWYRRRWNLSNNFLGYD